MKKIYNLLFFICLLAYTGACSDDTYDVPEGKINLQNDCIKRTLGPNLVGEKIEFAYAMAVGKEHGKLVSAKIEASIAGAAGTYIDNKSYHTGVGGNDIGVEVCLPSVNSGNATDISFSTDTCAATLRYYYVIPEEARGKTVSFNFSAKDSNGATVSYHLGPYSISNMDIKLDIVMKNNSYFSIADMEAHENTSAVDAAKIDLVYLYRTYSTVNFLHALVAPAADDEYLPGIALPSGANNNTPMQKTYGAIDQQLARNQYGVFIDDLDFREITFANASNYALNIKKDSGMWLESIDGVYRAFLYVNKIDNANEEITVSVKRLKVK